MSVLQGVSKTHLVMAWSKHKIIFLPIFNRSNFQCNEIMLTNESKRIWFCVWIIFRGTNITYPRNKLFFKQPVVNCVKISSRWNSSGQGFKANWIKQCKVHLSCENFVYRLKPIGEVESLLLHVGGANSNYLPARKMWEIYFTELLLLRNSRIDVELQFLTPCILPAPPSFTMSISFPLGSNGASIIGLFNSTWI